MEDDDLIHTCIHGNNVIGRRLHDPGQMDIRIRFLDGIADRQGMDDIANGAEFDNQDILHDTL